jgi:hypothetical protein
MHPQLSPPRLTDLEPTTRAIVAAALAAERAARLHEADDRRVPAAIAATTAHETTATRGTL